MSDARPYYSEKGLSAAYYDTITALDPGHVGDIDLYAELTPAGGSVLELGAGTGRVAFALAERGYSVLGIDLAPTMLSQAQAKLAEAPSEIAGRLRFQRGDMTSLSLGETFDAVICAYFSLAHLPTGTAWRNVFKGVAKALKPGAAAAFHLPIAEKLAAPSPVPPDRPVITIPADDAGRRLSVFIAERSSKPAVNRFDQVLDYVLTDPRGREERRARERLTYYVIDPTPFAEAAGLTVDRAPVVLGGTGEIHVFRKP